MDFSTYVSSFTVDLSKSTLSPTITYALSSTTITTSPSTTSTTSPYPPPPISGKFFGLAHQYLAKSRSKRWNILATPTQCVTFRFTERKDAIKQSRPDSSSVGQFQHELANQLGLHSKIFINVSLNCQIMSMATASK
ncbi:hypothetical protein BASA62_008704 [Batrachochytrium salamandrivorans]|nr:hypothetical protein BASA62_008704 [Batrachochytrium salamandrivorans]